MENGSANQSARTLCVTLCLLIGLPGCAGRAPDDEVRRILEQAVIVDTHIDAPFRIERTGDDLAAASERGQFDLPRAMAGSLDVAFMSIFIPATADEAGNGLELADRLIDHVESLATRAPDRAAIVTCVDDVRRQAAAGRVGLALGMENGGPLSARADALDRLFARGVRYVSLAHARSNALSDSSYDDDERWQGLSPAGAAMVQRMNDLGVMVDVSHLSDRAFWAVLEASAVPVIASHSSSRFFTPGFSRNLDDAMIEALAAKGGVVQVNFGSSYIAQPAREWQARRDEALRGFIDESGVSPFSEEARAFLARYVGDHPFPYADISVVLDHIDRIVALTGGARHVGLGSDFEGVGDTLPRGLEDVSRYPNVVQGLLDRGYGREEIRGILGENLLRVWKAAEDHAKERGQGVQCRSEPPA